MITDAKIRELRNLAAEDGDIVLQVLCDVATGEDLGDELDDEGYPDFSGGGHSAQEFAEIRRVLRDGRRAARAELASR